MVTSTNIEEVADKLRMSPDSIWAAVVSNGRISPNKTLLVMEFVSENKVGSVKRFIVDGLGQLWLPDIYSTLEGATTIFPVGTLLALSVDPTSSWFIETFRGKSTFIIPVNRNA